jgi:cytochrome b pre-mRNA-processing protein 3
MLRFLFPRLTPKPASGAKLFDAVTALARDPHWYVEGAVPDTLDGRFATLATIAALALVRLEQLGEEGEALSVALTEQFIHVMEAEHRELGLGDPKLGRTVRKLVGSLGRRVELWRAATAGDRSWDDAVRDSLYKAAPPAEALAVSAPRLHGLWSRLAALDLPALAEGTLA